MCNWVGFIIHSASLCLLKRTVIGVSVGIVSTVLAFVFLVCLSITSSLSLPSAFCFVLFLFITGILGSSLKYHSRNERKYVYNMISFHYFEPAWRIGKSNCSR